MHLDIRVSEESEFFDMKLLKEFCSRARSYNNDIGDDFQVRSLGGNEQSAEIILNLIKQGKKTGTFSLPWIANAKNYDETISGKNVILCDYHLFPKVLVQIVNPILTKFGDINANFTRLDGPAVRDVLVWKKVHRDYWNGLLGEFGKVCSDDMPVIVEPFKLIYEDNK